MNTSGQNELPLHGGCAQHYRWGNEFRHLEGSLSGAAAPAFQKELKWFEHVVRMPPNQASHWEETSG